MGIVKIQYGENVVNWPDCVQEVYSDDSGGVYVITTDNMPIILRQFDTAAEAVAAKNTLIARIATAQVEADGNGDIIVTIDDL